MATPTFQVNQQRFIEKRIMKLVTLMTLFGLFLNIPVAPVNFISGAADTWTRSTIAKCPDTFIGICQNGECHANYIGKD